MAEQRKDQPPTPSGRPGRRGLRTAGLALAAVLLAGAGFGGFAYWKLNRNITGVDVDSLLGRARPPASTNGDFNILLLGSDSRAGANHAKAGGSDDGTARSDTAMVVHVERDHRHASVVSVPRDALVDRPACTRPDGTVVPAAPRTMFNSAFEVGGAACAVKTVEDLSGLRMDHFVEIDFAGFAAFVDAIGGVDVTTTVDISDRQSHLTLPRGTHHLGGDQALAFVRTRHGVGDGSDLGRMELQQQMVRSILARARSAGLLTDPVRLYRVADTLTRSVTADTDLASVNALVGLSQTLRHLGPGDLSLATMPVRRAPADPNRVVADEPLAGRLWAALKDDRPIPPEVLRRQPANPATSVPRPASAAPSAPGASSHASPAHVPSAHVRPSPAHPSPARTAPARAAATAHPGAGRTHRPAHRPEPARAAPDAPGAPGPAEAGPPPSGQSAPDRPSLGRPADASLPSDPPPDDPALPDPVDPAALRAYPDR
ncbi:LCP family protein [Streptacidiphilus sp. ASG 303]|uniref:LCP family protein n=1 Tax=Streptacidiphilus sp. ASG 303 TaxID=2896847 RepID=UPI001E5FF3B1|nr:LCP family protein [Streptacidiphilus sp. ASG 303]MCD0482945.1 LCP family protein [Streptacidiphilus sp. ASG 303]